MLNHFIQPANYSSGEPIESVKPVRAFTPNTQLPKLLIASGLPERDRNEGDEEGISIISNEEVEERKDLLLPEIFKIILNTDLTELAEVFLVDDHQFIFRIRQLIWKERGLNRLTMMSTINEIHHDIDMHRENVYEVHVQLFRTPKGFYCHIIG